MKRSIVIMIAIVVVSAMLPLSSCTKENPTTGILSLTFLKSDGTPLASSHVILATSYQNAMAGTFYAEGWTDTNGHMKFMELPPALYWYKADGFDDLGATVVDAGVDHHVVVWLNSPSGGK